MNTSKLNKRSDSSIQVLARAADILRALKQDSSGLSLGKIAARVGLPRSTVQRIVNALMTEELVTTFHNNSGYRIGPEIFALAEQGRQDVRTALHPLMEDLSRQTGETVDLAIFRNDQMVFIDQIPGSHRLRTVSAIGESFPMTITANGKAALCWLQPDTIARICQLESEQNKHDERPELTLAELENIRTQGFALDIDRHTDGISAIGIAFQVASAIYAVSIPAPSHRFKQRVDSFTTELLNFREVIVKAIPGAKISSSQSDT